MTMNELLFIDLSEWRHYIKRMEFVKMQEAGLSGIFTRVSLGESYIDPTANKFLRWSDDLGLITGGYHYLTRHQPGLNPAVSGEEQAINYLASSFTLSNIDFHWLDVEAPGIKWATIVGFVEYMRRMGQKIGLYTRESYWNPQPPAKPRFNEYPDIFDAYWFADYRGGHRWLNDWRTKPEDERYRPSDVLINGAPVPHLGWQFGSLKYKWNEKVRAIDGNVMPFSTQREMLLVGNEG